MEIIKKTAAILMVIQSVFAAAQEPATIFPSDLTGTWTAMKQWSFTGTAGSPPPAPWRTGVAWAGAHPTLGGHVWRQAVNTDRSAYLDGNGALKIEINYRPNENVVETGYLITYPDNAAPVSTDYKAAPTDDGIWLEARVRYPNATTSICVPTPTWFAWWL